MKSRWSLLDLLRLLPGTSLMLTTAFIVLTLFSGLVPAALVVASGALLDAIPAAVADGLQGPRGEHVLGALAFLGGLFFVQQLLGPALQVTADVLGRRLTRLLRGRVMAASLGPAGISHLERAEVLNLVSEASGVGTARVTPREALVSAANVGVLRLQSLCCAVVLAWFHWWLALGLLGTYAVLTYGSVHDFRVSARAVAESPALLRRSRYLRDLALSPEAAKDIRLFGLQNWLAEELHTEWQQGTAVLDQARFGRPWLGPVLGLGTLISQGGVYLFLGVAVAHGQLTPGHFVMYAGAALGMVAALGVSPDNVNIGVGSAVVPIVRALERTVRPEGKVTRVSGAGPAPGDIRFEHVAFRYPGSEKPVFEDLDLEIPLGRSLAVVGLNGAGKTTLVKLLCGFYEPDQGRVLIGGTPLAKVRVEAWQAQICAVFQDFVRYELSARENIGFGSVRHLDETTGLAKSAEASGASDVLAELGIGWDTVLSARYEGGQDLSGGQWQRIALARALFAVRHGARLLVMDEPTAALDARAEAEFYERFLSLTAGVTSVIISHRFSTVRRADRIVVLEHGRVIEGGDHDSLVAEGGRYAQMFHAQARNFIDPGHFPGAPAGGPDA